MLKREYVYIKVLTWRALVLQFVLSIEQCDLLTTVEKRERNQSDGAVYSVKEQPKRIDIEYEHLTDLMQIVRNKMI
jgi:hypothetical protein